MLSNKDWQKAYAAEYQRSHPEQSKEKQRRYRAKHLEKLRARDRARVLTREEKDKKNAQRRARHKLAKDKWRAAHPEYQQEYRNRPDVKVRKKRTDSNGHLNRKFGIGISEFEQMFEAQGRVCAICGSADSKHKNAKFCVDHDHETGLIRGLLCKTCNWMLGQSGDNPDVLRKGADYLEAFMKRIKTYAAHHPNGDAEAASHN